ncbi:uncharacterized protein LOC134286050 [Aedes albopictus]|uniref:Integrase catalytic domain-containing protein n=1 Tax=Aedes albopictus TaxID=7160 RepID=A0ABM1ZM86_AEDAL
MKVFADGGVVADRIDAARPVDLVLLHRILFCEDTTLNWIRRRVLRFGSFDFERQSPQFEVRLQIIENAEPECVKTTCEILDVQIGEAACSRQTVAVAIMERLFTMANEAGNVAENVPARTLTPPPMSLLAQTTEYGFSVQSQRPVGQVNKNQKENSIARSVASSKSVQVTVMKARLEAERKLAELEEQEAVQRRERQRKLLKAELELKIAEAELNEELVEQRELEPCWQVQVADPLDRVQRWVQNLQSASSEVKGKDSTVQQRNTNSSSLLEQSMQERSAVLNSPSTSGTASYSHGFLQQDRGIQLGDVNTEMLQITKSMQRMLARSTGNNNLPTFDGNVREWQLFINQYRLSTEAGEYSGIENVVRLNKCLVGKAREAVQHMLMTSVDGEEIIKALELRFGRPELLLRALINEIKYLPAVSDWSTFIEFDGVVRNLAAGVKSLKQHVYNPELLGLLLQKLPQYQIMMWGRHITERGIDDPTVLDFAAWVEQTSKYASSINCTLAAGGFFDAPIQHGQSNIRSETRKGELKRCGVCHKDVHDVTICEVFKSAEPKRRFQIAIESKLCFCCLRTHSGRCDRRQQCPVEGCSRYHHALLHKGEATAPLSVPQNNPSVNVMKYDHRILPQALLKILTVKVRGPKGVIEIPALIDEGSNLTILDAGVAKILGISGSNKRLCFTLMSGMMQVDENSEDVQIEVGENLAEKPFYNLAGVRTVRKLNLVGQRVNVPELVSRYPYVNKADLKCLNGESPLLLIGQPHINVIKTTEVYQSEATAPAISKCSLGWVVHGPMMVSTGGDYPGTVNLCCEAEENLHDLVTSYILLENMGVVISKPDRQRSEDDRRALAIMEQSTRFVDGQFVVNLPYKSSTPFPESKKMALSRLKCTERKIAKMGIAGKYADIMQDYLDKKYAVAVSDAELELPRDNIWYLPHFPVENVMKPGKIRIVFDAAAKSNGICLNDMLITGPDLLKSLQGVLLRFRCGKIGFVGDVKEMFNRIWISEADSWSQCFVYRSSPRDPVQTYRMKAMIFGANSSPFIAHYIKNHNAQLHADEYPEASNAIVHDHYVDDFLGSEDDVFKAAELIQDVIQVHKAGGFEIRNFRCSSEEVLDSIPPHLKAETCSSDISDGIQRVLGQLWDSEKDCFTFSTNFCKIDSAILSGKRVPTKREVLSVVMSIFDPLGFATPMTIGGRILLQQIWRSGIGWDDQLEDGARKKWSKWLSNLSAITNVRVPRCYNSNLRTSDRTELHVFCDASTMAMAAVAYLRVVKGEQVDVSFVASRGRVAPVRFMSVPKLELQAALLGYRLSLMVKKEMEIDIHSIVFCTDSRTVLCWLKTKKALKTFVANKVGEILEQSSPDDWHYVSTLDNVADEGTRDTEELDMSTTGRWFTGPDMLKHNVTDWSTVAGNEDTSEEAEDECCVETLAVNTMLECDAGLPDVNRFSQWRRLIRSTAFVRKFIDMCRGKMSNGKIQPRDEQEANMLWVKTVQKDQFPEEYAVLMNHGELKAEAKLKTLAPFLDCDGIIRVGGRLNKANVDPAVKNPIILGASGRFVSLLVQSYHQRAHHHGRELVLNEIRQTYWIIGLRSLLRKIIFGCQYCRVTKPKQIIPIMGQLPECRVEMYKHPFTHTGMDFFGPFEVRVGRRREKRYGVVFICMTTRAVHVEMAHSLTTDSCVMSIRRMMARRRKPDYIYSDNGTNLRGADRELKDALNQLSFGDVEREVMEKGIQWVFNPPAASHMGGSWERVIRSIRTSLRVTLKERAPRQEVLETLLIEAEHLVNSRPLTYVSSDINDCEALTPNHFLIGASSNVQSPGVFNQGDLDWGKQWRKAQKLIDNFWRRWVKEYMPTLLPRQKWCQSVGEIGEGDIVYVSDMINERGKWPLAVVKRCWTGDDNIVRVAEVRTHSGTYRRPCTKLKKIYLEGDIRDDKPVSHQGAQCKGT